jgi:aminopeptidase
MATELIERYAEVVVRVGANVREGQDVFIRADIAHAPIARAITEQAYLAGARRVMVDYSDGHVQHSTLQHAPMETLTSAPEWVLERLRSWTADEAAVISLTGQPEPNLMADIDPARAAAVPLELAAMSRKALLGGEVAWTIVAAPNPGWATQIFGEPDVDRLWDAVRVVMRLDEPDAVAAWEAHRDTLIARAGRITDLDLDAVRYHGDGTDLTVGLLPGSVWTGGQLVTNSGRVCMPNLPTEEVFTSPDRSRADGEIALTRPLVMPRTGTRVEGLRATFDGGRIVDVHADEGADAVRAELDTDEGARSLGEVALLDKSSRVRAAGVVFHDTLYDENAGCHVAWGQSFPFALEGGVSMGSDELFERGLNRSAVHTDVVVGGPGVSVEGITRDGRVVPLIIDDEWALPA